MEQAQSGHFGPAEFQAVANVSRETLARVKLFVSLLEEWNARHNLVSARSLGEVWRRHVWDSAQLAAFVPQEANVFPSLSVEANLEVGGYVDRRATKGRIHETFGRFPVLALEAARHPVLAGVKTFELQYLNPGLVWVNVWPSSPADPPIPQAVRLRIVLDSSEEIVRVFALQS